LLVLLGGCTQILGIPDPRHGPDAGADATACDPAGDFSTVMRLPSISTDARDEQSLWLTRDELTMVFTRDVAGRHGDLFVAHRETRSESFDDPFALDTLSSDDDEYRASLSQDGLTIYFDRQVNGTKYMIFTATRQTPEHAFGAPEVMPLINSEGQDFEPFVADNGLFFASTRIGGLAGIYHAARDGAAFAAPDLVINMATGVAAGGPVVSFDGLTIYFSSAASASNPDADVWTASRTSRDQVFGAPHRVSSVNTRGLDSPQWISGDNCRLYLSTDRDGTRDFWMAERSAP
jgi:WD40-like Beta Propeller Repeat